MNLTGIGIWSSQLRYGNAAESADAAAELDELGFRVTPASRRGGARCAHLRATISVDVTSRAGPSRSRCR
jgi:hypothetical protein